MFRVGRRVRARRSFGIINEGDCGCIVRAYTADLWAWTVSWEGGRVLPIYQENIEIADMTPLEAKVVAYIDRELHQ